MESNRGLRKTSKNTPQDHKNNISMGRNLLHKNVYLPEKFQVKFTNFTLRWTLGLNLILSVHFILQYTDIIL